MQPLRQDRRGFLIAAATAAAGIALKPALGQSQDLAALTLKQASELLRSKGASPVDLTRACLQRIEKYNPALNAFITVTGQQALATARDMEAEQRRGKWRGPLHGIPIALKDNIDTAGIRTTAASGVFKDRVPSEDAEVVRRLKDAGAVLLGKLNLHEFAYGGTSDVSYFGAVHNPWALDHITGGSSGGSAAATAADLCFGSLGTDTAGSVRIPSSYCGVVGFKPTYGRVSLRGVIPLSWTLDHVGPICRTVEDASLMLSVIAGYDQMDPASVDVPVPDYTRAFKMETSRLRLGIPRSPFFENLDPEVAKAVQTAIGVLTKLAKSVNETRLPPVAQLLLPITGVEAYAYHSKWIAESPNKYQPFTRDRIIQLAAGVTASAYAGALRQTYLLRREITKVFSTVDLLLTPTMPHPAETFAESKNFDKVGLQNTSPFDIFGLPTISVLCGFTASGLPIGLQISGAPFAESTVLSLAQAYERETEWHKKRPALTPA
ncbi:MAG: amidase [Bryobacteraceae bacterium]|jgi:aspartyl-tRNA(Asn)/glutamyl-tRNA(Gln) amidotransferase subunit A